MRKIGPNFRQQLSVKWLFPHYIKDFKILRPYLFIRDNRLFHHNGYQVFFSDITNDAGLYKDTQISISQDLMNMELGLGDAKSDKGTSSTLKSYPPGLGVETGSRSYMTNVKSSVRSPITMEEKVHRWCDTSLKGSTGSRVLTTLHKSDNKNPKNECKSNL